MIYEQEKPPISQRTCKMVFTNKPGKPNSKKLTDKRKISLLNSDFKILTGSENKRFTKILTHTISDTQFALGETKRIHHAISLSHDAIFASNKKIKAVRLVTLTLNLHLITCAWTGSLWYWKIKVYQLKLGKG